MLCVALTRIDYSRGQLRLRKERVLAMQVFELTPDPKPKRWKRGAGTVAYSDAGDLFVNSELVGMSAMTAFLCCSADGTQMITSGQKVLVPIDWAIRERPELEQELGAFRALAATSKEKFNAT